MLTRLLSALLLYAAAAAQDTVAQSLMEWAREFPKTDFSRATVPLSEIRFDGARRDTIPPIHQPRFRSAADIADIGRLEPVISIVIDGDARAYPLRVMLWHEIVNDTVGGVPLLISYCPLCNSGVVFDRRLDDGRELTFGNTGRIRHFDMVMYDQQTESWWQQFSGTAIVGSLSGSALRPVASRLESIASFRERAPGGRVLVPDDPNARPYGTSPYEGMDTGRDSPVFAAYGLPAGVRPLDYVVTVGDRAWPLKKLMTQQRIEHGDAVLEWAPDRNSLHDTRTISRGRDLGNVVVKSRSTGAEIVYDLTFAFAFSAFVPDGQWMLD